MIALFNILINMRNEQKIATGFYPCVELNEIATVFYPCVELNEIATAFYKSLAMTRTRGRDCAAL